MTKVAVLLIACLTSLFAQSETNRWPGGWIDHATCDEIEGWAADAHHIDRQFPSNLIRKEDCGGEANLHRDDLQQNLGFGSGDYGFKLATPALKMAKRTTSVRIRHDTLLYGWIGAGAARGPCGLSAE